MNNLTVLVSNTAHIISANIIKIIIALILLWVGFKIIKKLVTLQTKAMYRFKMDNTLITYLGHVSKIALKVILIIVLLSFVGIGSSTLAALLGASVLAIGLSLKGSISNIAGGVIILFFKPFKIGDFIKTSCGDGLVENITLFYTYLVTPDNRVIYCPNGTLSSSSITNLSSKDIRRLDLIFTLPIENSIEVVKEALLSISTNNSLVLKEYPSQIFVSNQTGDTLEYSLSLWCNNEQFLELNHQIYEEIFKEFTRRNIKLA